MVVVVEDGAVVVVVEEGEVVVVEGVVVVVVEDGAVVVVVVEVVVVVVDSSDAPAVPDGSKDRTSAMATAILPGTTPRDGTAPAIRPHPTLLQRSPRSARRFAIGVRPYFTKRGRQGPKSERRYSAASLMASIIVGWATSVSTRVSVVTRALTARATMPISSEAR